MASPARTTPPWEESRPVFAALGDATRLRLVGRLGREGPLSIARLAEGERITRQGVTKHLEVLAGAALVRGTRAGREKRWELDPLPLAAAGRLLDDLARAWDARLERLRAFVEAPPAPGLRPAPPAPTARPRARGAAGGPPPRGATRRARRG